MASSVAGAACQPTPIIQARPALLALVETTGSMGAGAGGALRGQLRTSSLPCRREDEFVDPPDLSAAGSPPPCVFVDAWFAGLLAEFERLVLFRGTLRARDAGGATAGKAPASPPEGNPSSSAVAPGPRLLPSPDALRLGPKLSDGPALSDTLPGPACS
mmetsp:Transcript_2354/g.3770  ORF Transcript_2354/g.3770 Transcript_2354/m.3770 type:complete len:159 (-) Transcript_2354:269-745(-)